MCCYCLVLSPPLWSGGGRADYILVWNSHEPSSLGPITPGEPKALSRIMSMRTALGTKTDKMHCHCCISLGILVLAEACISVEERNMQDVKPQHRSMRTETHSLLSAQVRSPKAFRSAPETLQKAGLTLRESIFRSVSRTHSKVKQESHRG